MATRWSPDTCSCVIEYDGVDDSGELINPVIITKCSEHQAVVDADLHDVVLNRENRVKNSFHGAMLDVDDLADVIIEPISAPIGVKVSPSELASRQQLGSGVIRIPPPEPVEQRTLKEGVGFSYYFEDADGTGANRVFHAITVGADDTHIATLQQAMDDAHGAGKVSVE